MKDKSKKLTVVNTGTKKVSTESVKETTNKVVQPSGTGSAFDLSAYLLKSVWNKVFEFRKDNNGIEYIFGKLPLVLQHGVTMYAEGDVEIPTLAEGLPYDGRTIWFNPETQQIEVIGGTGGGEGGTSNFWELNGIPSWITQAKPTYQYSEIKNTPDLSVYATTSLLNQTLAGYVTNNALVNTLLSYPTFTDLRDELKGYVNVDYKQDVVGIKNFINGIQIGELPITKLQDDVIYIDANLVVRGGVTMFYENGELDMPTIIDEIGIAGYDGKKLGLVSFSSSQFSIDANGIVTIIGGSTGLDTAQLAEYLTNNKYATQGWVTSQGYASSSSLVTLQTKVNDFLEGSDTDTIINKWKELESFLSGLSESDNLSDILATKANQSSLDATNATVATKWTQNDSKISNWDTAFSWGDHSKNDYTTNKYVNDTFVTIGGNTEQTITGAKNFTGGLKVNGSPIIYDATNKYWKLEGDLLVTGGVTMYGVDEGDLPSILDSLPIASTTALGIAKYDSNYFSVNSDGLVTLINAPSSGATSGLLGSFLLNVDDSVDTISDYDRVLYQPAGSSMWTWKKLSEIAPSGGVVSSAVRYLSTLGSTGQWYDTHWRLYAQWGLHDRLYLMSEDGYDVVANIAEKDGNGNIIASTYLPLSGGVLSNTLTIKNTDVGLTIFRNLNSATPYIRFGKDENVTYGEIGVHYNGFPAFFGGVSSQSGYGKWNAILHESNFSSYALPLSGGTLTGGLTVNGLIRSMVVNSASASWSQYLNYSKASLGVDLISSSGVHPILGWATSNGSYTTRMVIGSTSDTNSFGIMYLAVGTNSNGTAGRRLLLESSGTCTWEGNFSANGYVYGTAFDTNGIITARNGNQTYPTSIGVGACNLILGGYYSAKNGYNNGIGFNALMSYNHATYGNHLHAWIGLSPCTNSAQAETYNLVFAVNGSVYTNTVPNIGMVLQGNQNLLVYGGITMYSDARKKTILNNVELSLKQIANAPLIEHYYNSDQEKTTHVGSIAQYWYGMNDWFCKEDSEGYLTMEIQNCALASAISIARELDRYETKTDKTIRKMKQRIAELEEEVERFKQN